MDDKKTPVEINPTDAGTGAGVEAGEPKAPTVPEVDFLDEYNKLLEENARLAGERDNYKRIGLKIKKGEEPEQLTEEEIDKRAEARAQEIIQQKQREETQRKLQEIAQKAMKENRELKLALKNRSQIATTPSGAASDSGTKLNETFFSPDQIAYLKKKGIDPAKVKENYLKLKS